MTTKKQWGNACWYLFHTLAVKLKKEEEKKYVPLLLKYIMGFCANLPCPECSSHATSTLKKLNVRAVTTREKLIETIFVFHNIINGRVGNKTFTRKEHDELYSKASFFPIWYNFFNVMSISLKNEKALLNNFHRKKYVKDFDVWIRQNIQIFNV